VRGFGASGTWEKAMSGVALSIMGLWNWLDQVPFFFNFFFFFWGMFSVYPF